MKRILALIGLIVIGAMLLADPNTGIIAVVEEAAASTTAEATTTTAPPDPGTDDSESSVASDVDETSTSTADGSCESNSNLCDAEATTTPATAESGTYVGDAYDSEFGYFQVEITVDNGVMTSITTLDEPGDRKSQNINSSAIPYYTEQALDIQSADLDVMSGATVTWESWGASLDSALQMAGLA